MNTKEGWQPTSLAQRFDAPDGFRGEFGWLCGFSADASFLNDAAERFTRLTQGQRASEGRIRIALFLDPTNPQIRLPDVPGIAHLPIVQTASRPFRLFHAKVALLAFREDGPGQRWILRLIVSTGNWTRQTLEDSLDLAWSIDLPSEALQGTKGVGQACADIRAAWRLFDWIATQFDVRILAAGGSHGALASREKIVPWIQACERHARGLPRLFDNRRRSMWQEIQARLTTNEHAVARNYIAMGSGFYEAAANGEAVIPRQIIDRLIEERLLTKTCTADLYVNPLACQSIAQSVVSLKRGAPAIVVRPATTPARVFGDDRPRGLHAKFLFSANRREGAVAYSRPWVYLGSGNLTDAGFLQAASRHTGNFETGVMLFPEGVERHARKGLNDGRVITNLFPIQWDEECGARGDISSGDAWIPPEVEFVAPPVSHFHWHEDPTTTELRPGDGDLVGVDVLSTAGERCERTAAGFRWTGAMPRMVRLAWNDGRSTAEVPVLDQYGRMGATALPSIGLEEAWWQLADFPMPPEVDSQEQDVEIDATAGEEMLKAANVVNAQTPIRQMMQLIENVAARQTDVAPSDWLLWCARLEQTLGQAKKSEPVAEFIRLGINPISPLYAAPFRPAFADTEVSDAGRHYEAVLARIEADWNVADLARLGGQP